MKMKDVRNLSGLLLIAAALTACGGGGGSGSGGGVSGGSLSAATLSSSSSSIARYGVDTSSKVSTITNLNRPQELKNQNLTSLNVTASQYIELDDNVYISGDVTNAGLLKFDEDRIRVGGNLTNNNIVAFGGEYTTVAGNVINNGMMLVEEPLIINGNLTSEIATTSDIYIDIEEGSINVTGNTDFDNFKFKFYTEDNDIDGDDISWGVPRTVFTTGTATGTISYDTTLSTKTHWNAISISVTTTGKDLKLTVTRGGYSGPVAAGASMKANAAAVAAAVDAAQDWAYANPDLADKAFIKESTKTLLSPATVDEILASLSGEIHASSQTLLFQQSRMITRDLTNRIAMLNNTSDKTGAGAWGNALGSWGKVDKDNFIEADTEIYGLQVGADKYFSDKVLGGIALAATKATADFDDNGGKSNSTNITASVYGTYGLGDSDTYYLAGRVGAGYISAETDRNIISGASLVGANAKHDDMMYSAYAEFGAKYAFSDKYWFNPFVGYSYDLLDRSGFKESSSSGYALDVESEKYDIGQGHVGARVGADLGAVRAQVHAEVSFGEGKDQAFDAKIATTGNTMHIKGVPLADRVVNIGATVEGDIGANTTVYGSYEVSLENDEDGNNVFSLGMRYKF